MGYSAEAPAEKEFRDARILRIYEGTNEINRMVCVTFLLKKALSGQLDIMTPGMALTGELKSGKYNKMPESDDPFA